MLILGIESSCDETSVAVVKDGREVLSNVVLSQADIHAKYGGVVPEIASRAHTEGIYSLCEEALKKANVSLEAINAIAATYAPGLIGALLVGLNFGKALAYKLNVPLIPVHHIRGHIASAYLEHKELEPAFLAFVASGGHTSIIEVSGYTQFKLLGMTRDDAIGEAFDKIARAMGLPYPGGAEIEKLACSGDKDGVKIPMAKVSGSELDFSFSGIKTHIINYINKSKQKYGISELNDEEKRNIAASFTENVTQSILIRIKRAVEVTGHEKLVCAGGVMANNHIRNALINLCEDTGVEIYIPDRKYCSDNAAMIAAQGFYEFKNGNIAELNQNAFASMSVES